PEVRHKLEAAIHRFSIILDRGYPADVFTDTAPTAFERTITFTRPSGAIIWIEAEVGVPGFAGGSQRGQHQCCIKDLSGVFSSRNYELAITIVHAVQINIDRHRRGRRFR